MPKQLQCHSASILSSDLVAAKAEEALRLKNFKLAIELFKQLTKRVPDPKWRNSLADAYIGRAKALAAKGMFKEAEVVLGNVAAADGTVKEPILLLHCLIRQRQFQKALAHALKYVGDSSSDASGDLQLAELTAALFLAFPVPLRQLQIAQTARAKWVGAANAAHDALCAWTERKPEDEVEALLTGVALQSPFKAIRLILKSLLRAAHDPDSARRLLEGVAAPSPFAALRLAVEAALPEHPAGMIAKWNAAGAAQRAFAIEISVSPDSSQTLARLLEAERSGPAALFTFLLKQAAHLPMAQTRSACLNLLPRLPDRIAQFEKTFGVLPELEKNRILALASEESGHWKRAEKYWCAVAVRFQQDGAREAKLSAGIIYRHLAELARKQDEIEGQGYDTEPIGFYLKQSLNADPDHLPTLLQLIDHLRHEGDEKEWHVLAEEGARRFPEESAILLRAIDSAAARKAYKKAAGFARKLLVLDPINQAARQRMIDLQISHARKQMQSKRADLAMKELTSAAQWERADLPNAALRINEGLVGFCSDQGLHSEARLREGVELAGGEVVGWFRAALEEALLLARGCHVPIVRDELARCLKLEPKKQQIVAIVSVFGASDVRAASKATAELLWRFCRWIRSATAIQFSAAEFHLLADLLLRAEAFDLLGEFARAAKRRAPNEPVWRFYEIVARTGNNPDRMHPSETAELAAIGNRSRNPKDYHWVNRIRQYIEGSGDDPAAKRRARRLAARAEANEDEELEDAVEAVLKHFSPQDVQRLVKKHGRDNAIGVLVDTLVKSPVGAFCPRPALASMARTMVEAVLEKSSTYF
jgi:tetratricopeptide (TPR) repeat protein